MANCCRHFKALMRKNFMLWWRTPICSTFELLVPIVMMTILWVIRLQVPSTSVDQDGLYSKKYTTYRGFDNVDGAYNIHWDYLKNVVRDFFIWSDYSEKHNVTPEEYDPGWDFYNAMFWSPSHCLKTFDFNRPKVSSPIIGIIGAQSDITD